jgi:N-acetylneuraminic acid mutarotase
MCRIMVLAGIGALMLALSGQARGPQELGPALTVGLVASVDPAVRAWQARASLSTGRDRHGLAAAGGILYAVGGQSRRSGPLGSVEAYDPEADSWSFRAALPTPRSNLGLAATAEGRIVAAGGTSSSGVVANVEVYDPATDRWTVAAPMLTARADFELVAGPDGLLYAIGGADAGGQLVGAVERYDPAADSWSLRTPMPTPRMSVAAATAGDGLIFTVGGMMLPPDDYDGPDNYPFTVPFVEVYDPRSDTWTARGPLPWPRAWHALAAVSGRLFVLGGFVGSFLVGQPVDTTAEYLPASDTWVTRSAMPTLRFNFAAATLGDRLYAVGGETFGAPRAVEAYDPTADRLGPCPPLPMQLYDAGVAALDGKIYVVGGVVLSVADREANVLTTVQALDPSTGEWQARASIPTPRTGFAVTVLDNKLYAVGGRDASRRKLSTVEAYDPATDTWTILASMPTPRDELGLVAAGGLLFAIGGRDDGRFSGDALPTVEVYDPASGMWTARPPMPFARNAFGVAAGADGIIYIAGGGDTYSFSAAVWAYDPATDGWTERAPLNSEREGTALIPLPDGRIAAIGGVRMGDVEEATVELYDPAADRWTTGERLPTPRARPGAAVIAGRLYAVGGAFLDPAVVEVYDVDRDSWGSCATS